METKTRGRMNRTGSETRRKREVWFERLLSSNPHMARSVALQTGRRDQADAARAELDARQEAQIRREIERRRGRAAADGTELEPSRGADDSQPPPPPEGDGNATATDTNPNPETPGT